MSNHTNQFELFRQVPNDMAAAQFESLFGEEDRGSGRPVGRSGIDKSGHSEASGILSYEIDQPINVVLWD